jgi:hypothetical protein
MPYGIHSAAIGPGQEGVMCTSSYTLMRLTLAAVVYGLSEVVRRPEPSGVVGAGPLCCPETQVFLGFAYLRTTILFQGIAPRRGSHAGVEMVPTPTKTGVHKKESGEWR